MYSIQYEQLSCSDTDANSWYGEASSQSAPRDVGASRALGVASKVWVLDFVFGLVSSVFRV